MIVQEDIPYTKEEIQAMVKTIHDLREQVSRLGWHSASELPPVGENGNSIDVIAIDEDNEPIKVSYSKFYKCWVIADATAESFDKITIKWWCYPPKED